MSDSQPSDLATVRAQITEIILEAPNGFTYEPPGIEGQCKYTHVSYDDEGVAEEYRPGCIVGRWLHKFHNVEYKRMAAWDTEGGVTADEALWKSGIRLTPDALQWISALQREQDAGLPWSDVDGNPVILDSTDERVKRTGD